MSPPFNSYSLVVLCRPRSPRSFKINCETSDGETLDDSRDETYACITGDEHFRSRKVRIETHGFDGTIESDQLIVVLTEETGDFHLDDERRSWQSEDRGALYFAFLTATANEIGLVIDGQAVDGIVVLEKREREERLE